MSGDWELTWTAQHGLYCAGRERIVAFDDELMGIVGDQFDEHGVGALASTVLDLLVLILFHSNQRVRGLVFVLNLKAM